jgi:hypothetical protein
MGKRLLEVKGGGVNTRNRVVAFRLTAEEYEDLKDCIEYERLTLSSAVRRFVVQGINRAKKAGEKRIREWEKIRWAFIEYRYPDDMPEEYACPF